MRAQAVLVALLVLLLPLRALAIMPQLACAMGQCMEAAAVASEGCSSHDDGRAQGHDGCEGDAGLRHTCSGGACCPHAAAAPALNAVERIAAARSPLSAHLAAPERTHIPPLPERPPSVR